MIIIEKFLISETKGDRPLSFHIEIKVKMDYNNICFVDYNFFLRAKF
jgi:hypothetical protein